MKYHREAMSQGRLARLDGFDMLSQNPYEENTWMWQSFNVGWKDADDDPSAIKEVIHSFAGLSK